MRPIKKLIIVGDGACGKTSLLFAFRNSSFSEDHQPTIYETYTTQIQVGTETVNFTLSDTAGEEDYDRLRPLAYTKTDVVLVCFNVDNPVSLKNVHLKWCPEVKHFCPGVPFVLVGTKLDLRNDPIVQDQLMRDDLSTVSHRDGIKSAKKIRAAFYIECSAKTLEGVKTVFQTAAKLVLERKSVAKCRPCHVL